MTSETSATAPNGSPGHASSRGENRPDAASRPAGTGSNPGRTAGDDVAENREAGAPGSQGADPGRPVGAQPSAGGPKVGRTAHAAADSLDHAARYIREHDAASMLTDVKRLVKDNPVPALIGAAILGFVIARTLSRD